MIPPIIPMIRNGRGQMIPIIRNGTELGDAILNRTHYVALCMSRVCRFGGQIPVSVLLHSLNVEFAALAGGYSEHVQLWALLHDCHEIVTGDITRGFKCRDLHLEQKLIDTSLKLRVRVNFSESDIQQVRYLDGIVGDEEAAGFINRRGENAESDWISMWADRVQLLINKLRIQE